MPITVFIDFFSSMDVGVSKTMLSVKCANMEDILEFVDEGWDTKVENGVTCNVVEGSVTCKFMLSTQNFIMTFFYARWHTVGGNLVPLDQDMENFSADPILDVDVWLNNELLTIVKIRSMCTLHQLRLDLQSEEVVTPTSYSFQLQGAKVSLQFMKYFCIVFFVYYHSEFCSDSKKTRKECQIEGGSRLQSRTHCKLNTM